MALKAILFDYGNTLVSTRLDWKRILPANMQSLSKALLAHFPGLDHGRLSRDFLFFRQEGKRRAARELIETPAVDSLRQALAVQGTTEVSDEVLQAGVDAFFSPEEAAYPIIFGVPEAVAKLKAMGQKLAVVSNATCGRLIRRALEQRGLLGYFDHVAVSADLGPCKPDPAIFWGTMHALEMQPTECVVVGDQLESDIEGARRAGMRAVLTDFFGDAAQIPPGGPRPDAVARNPQELLELLKSWDAGRANS